MVRKEVTPEVATPRSEKSTVFCTISTRICMHIPMPAPSTIRYSDWISVDVSGPIRDSSRKPMAMTALPAIGKILYLPVRPTITPLLSDIVSMPATIGRVCRPDVVADTPSTNCMKVGRSVKAPSIAKPTTNDSPQHTAKTGSRNSRIGRIGSCARSSTATNALRTTNDATKRPMINGELHA